MSKRIIIPLTDEEYRGYTILDEETAIAEIFRFTKMMEKRHEQM